MKPSIDLSFLVERKDKMTDGSLAGSSHFTEKFKQYRSSICALWLMTLIVSLPTQKTATPENAIHFFRQLEQLLYITSDNKITTRSLFLYCYGFWKDVLIKEHHASLQNLSKLVQSYHQLSKILVKWSPLLSDSNTATSWKQQSGCSDTFTVKSVQMTPVQTKGWLWNSTSMGQTRITQQWFKGLNNHFFKWFLGWINSRRPSTEKDLCRWLQLFFINENLYKQIPSLFDRVILCTMLLLCFSEKTDEEWNEFLTASVPPQIIIDSKSVDERFGSLPGVLIQWMTFISSRLVQKKIQSSEMKSCQSKRQRSFLQQKVCSRYSYQRSKHQEMVYLRLFRRICPETQDSSIYSLFLWTLWETKVITSPECLTWASSKNDKDVEKWRASLVWDTNKPFVKMCSTPSRQYTTFKKFFQCFPGDICTGDGHDVIAWLGKSMSDLVQRWTLECKSFAMWDFLTTLFVWNPLSIFFQRLSSSTHFSWSDFITRHSCIDILYKLWNTQSAPPQAVLKRKVQKSSESSFVNGVKKLSDFASSYDRLTQQQINRLIQGEFQAFVSVWTETRHTDKGRSPPQPVQSVDGFMEEMQLSQSLRMMKQGKTATEKKSILTSILNIISEVLLPVSFDLDKVKKDTASYTSFQDAVNLQQHKDEVVWITNGTLPVSISPGMNAWFWIQMDT